MLQQQQSVLQGIVAQQDLMRKEMQEHNKKLEERINLIEEKVKDKFETSASSSSSSNEGKKVKVTRFDSKLHKVIIVALLIVLTEKSCSCT